MRIWSIHPKYLDSKGLVALWRESLLAKKVLRGKTRGYKNHPQLTRFKEHENSKGAINFYLKFVLQEAELRKFSFNKNKINLKSKAKKIKVSLGQINYEICHLKNKLFKRDKKALNKIINVKAIEPHPLFEIVPGKIEHWERIN